LRNSGSAYRRRGRGIRLGSIYAIAAPRGHAQEHATRVRPCFDETHGGNCSRRTANGKHVKVLRAKWACTSIIYVEVRIALDRKIL
jgi:hypothetical protein